MKCVMQLTDEIDEATGRRKMRCARLGCRKVLLEPPQGNTIDLDCDGWPFAHEARQWAEGLVATLGTREAARFYKKALWRLRGSPIDELPPGVPRPILAPLPAPEDGPGTELAAIFKHAGASSDECAGVCKEWQDEMNIWGVEGCRAKSNRALIIKRITEAAYKTWVTEQVRIGWSISREPWFRIADPVGCIVDEAVRRAGL